MRRRVSETILSFAIAVCGFYLLYVNISDAQHLSAISVLIALTLLIMGVLMLFKSGRHDHTKTILPDISYNNREKSQLLKNNELLRSYQKHSKMRDKLKAIRHLE